MVGTENYQMDSSLFTDAVGKRWSTQLKLGGTWRNRSGRINRFWIMVGCGFFRALQAQNVPSLK